MLNINSYRLRHLPARGFSLVELMVSLVIMSVLVGLIVPSVMQWITSTRANSMVEFYLDGLRRARDGAIKNDGAARFTMVPNPGNANKFDWQIDWCTPTPMQPCDEGSGVWSSPTSPVSTAPGQPRGPSILRSAESLPDPTFIAVSTNGNADSIYFTSTGWVDTQANGGIRIQWIRFVDRPTEASPEPWGIRANPKVNQISLNLAGIAVRCLPSLPALNQNIPATDSRICP